MATNRPSRAGAAPAPAALRTRRRWRCPACQHQVATDAHVVGEPRVPCARCLHHRRLHVVMLPDHAAPAPALGGSLCPATGKQSHRSRDKAAAHKAGLAVRRGYRGDVYWCRHCLGWHVGLRRK